MKHIIRILFAVALLIAVPTTMNAQSPKGKTTKGKVTTKANGTTKTKTTTTPKIIEKNSTAKGLEIINKAKKGDAEAQFYLGQAYTGKSWTGIGVAKDFKLALYWTRKSAEQGCVMAQTELGFWYSGITVIVKEDLNQSKYWFQKAAEQGDAMAQYRLGKCYYHGDGVAKDLKQAVYWYRKAAEQGDEDAKKALEEVEKKFSPSALESLKNKAQNGDSKAQFELGRCYHEGEGFTKDYQQAVYWFRKAAEKGNANAQFYLGLCYYNGEGVAKDEQQAIYWFRKAAEQGDLLAKVTLEKIEKKSQPSSSSSQAKSSTSSSSGQVHDVVEQMPQFPGGQSALFQFLSQNIHYPEICEKKGIQGRVICSCVVDTDGSITDVQVKQSVDPNLDREAVRVIQSMPKWTPGKENGLPVRVRYTIPITFRLQ